MTIALAGIRNESDAQLHQIIPQLAKLVEKTKSGEEELEKLLVNLLAIYINHSDEDDYIKLCKLWSRFVSEKERRNLKVVPADMRPNIIDLTCTGLGLVVLVQSEKKDLLRVWLKRCKEEVVLFLFRAYLKRTEYLVFLLTEVEERVSVDAWSKMGESVRKVLTHDLIKDLRERLSRKWWFLKGEEELLLLNVDKVCELYYTVPLDASVEFISTLYKKLEGDVKKSRAWMMHWLCKGVYELTNVFCKDDTLCVYAASQLMKQNRFDEALHLLDDHLVESIDQVDEDEDIRMRAKRYELAGHLYAHKREHRKALGYFVSSVVVFMQQRIMLQVGSDGCVLAGRCEKIVQLLLLLSRDSNSEDESQDLEATWIKLGVAWEKFVEPLVVERISSRPRVLSSLVFGPKLHVVSKLLTDAAQVDKVADDSVFGRLVNAIRNQLNSVQILETRFKSNEMSPLEQFLLQYLTSLQEVMQEVDESDGIDGIDFSIDDPRQILEKLNCSLRELHSIVQKDTVLTGRMRYWRKKAKVLTALKCVYAWRRPYLKKEVEYYSKELERIPKCFSTNTLLSKSNVINENSVSKAILREDEEALGEFIIRNSDLQNQHLYLALRYYCDLPMEAYDLRLPRNINKMLLSSQLEEDLSRITWLVCINDRLLFMHKNEIMVFDFPTTLEEEFERIVLENRESVGKEVTRKAMESEEGRRSWWRTRKALDKRMQSVISGLQSLLNVKIDDGEEMVLLGLCRRCQRLPWEDVFDRPVARVAFLPFGEDRMQTDSSVSYLLNPQGDLEATERMFLPLLKEEELDCTMVKGVTGRLPTFEEYEELLKAEHFLFFGHSGPNIPNNNDSKKMMSEVCCKSVLMGCSSARGERCATRTFLTHGSPLVLGNLWDVTDRDIDRFTLKLLTRLNILPPVRNVCNLEKADCIRNWTRELREAREECLLRFLNGSAPVLYVNVSSLTDFKINEMMMNK